MLNNDVPDSGIVPSNEGFPVWFVKVTVHLTDSLLTLVVATLFIITAGVSEKKSEFIIIPSKIVRLPVLASVFVFIMAHTI